MATPEGAQQKALEEVLSEFNENTLQEILAHETGDQESLSEPLTKSDEQGLELAPVQNAQDQERLNAVIKLITKLEKQIRKQCGVGEKSCDREFVAKLRFHEAHLHDLTDVWAKNYFHFQDPISIMDDLGRYETQIVALLEKYKEYEEDGESGVDSQDSDGDGSVTHSECSAASDSTEVYRSHLEKKVEERVQRGVRSKELTYGDSSLDLDIFHLRLDQYEGPEWLCKEGFKEMTSRWLELDDQARKEILDHEAKVNSQYQITPVESKSDSQARHSCFCGQSCWIKHAAYLRVPQYTRDRLENAEREAEYRAERTAAEQARFTCDVKRFVQCLECSLDIGEGICYMLQNLLRDIVVHAKGKNREDEPYEYEAIDLSKKWAAGPARSLKLYCRWLRNNPEIDVDAELLESARRVLERSTLMEEEETTQPQSRKGKLIIRVVKHKDPHTGEGTLHHMQTVCSLHAPQRDHR
ncbi:hypothetical protein V8E51_001591 [Hyaloscypha variabilis]